MENCSIRWIVIFIRWIALSTFWTTGACPIINDLASELVENRSFQTHHNRGNCNFYRQRSISSSSLYIKLIIYYNLSKRSGEFTICTENRVGMVRSQWYRYFLVISVETEKRNTSEDFHLFRKLSFRMSCTIWICNRNFRFLLTKGKIVNWWVKSLLRTLSCSNNVCNCEKPNILTSPRTSNTSSYVVSQTK